MPTHIRLTQCMMMFALFKILTPATNTSYLIHKALIRTQTKVSTSAFIILLNIFLQNLILLNQLYRKIIGIG